MISIFHDFIFKILLKQVFTYIKNDFKYYISLTKVLTCREIVLIWSFSRLLSECHWLADSAPCQICQNRNSQVCAKELFLSLSLKQIFISPTMS